MKKYLTIALFFVSMAAFGQNARTEEYASVRIAKAPLSNKLIFILDDGVDRGFKTAFFEGPDKKSMTVKTIPEVLNTVNQFGWEFISMEKDKDSAGEYTMVYLRRRIAK